MFGARDVAEIDSLVNDFCVAVLASEVAEFLFRATSLGVVVCVVLDDAHRVVVKVHQPRETPARLQAVHEARAALFEAGLPSPQPLVGPVGLGNGYAVAETLIDAGEFRDTHDSACRGLLAEALAWHWHSPARSEAPRG